MKRFAVQLVGLLAVASFCSGEERNNNEICLGAPNLSYVGSLISCSYYYACIDGTAYGYSCDDGKWFSTERQQCVPPEESDCDIEQPPDQPTAPPPTPSPQCDGVQDYRYVPSSVSCQYYYQCIDEIAYRLSCPKGSWFNEEHQRCGNRYEFECDLEPTTPPPAANRCTGEPNFGSINDPEYCHRFFTCMNGVPFPMICWDDLWFDYEQQSCVEPSGTTCDATTPSPYPPPMPNACDGVEDDKSVQHYSTCNEYFTCNGAIATLAICRAGQWFDVDRQECVHPMDAYCPHGPTTTPTPDVCIGAEDGILVAAPNNCSSYYVCANEIGYRVFCPPSQYFNEGRQMCDDRQNVICRY